MMRVCGWTDIDACEKSVRESMFTMLFRDEKKFLPVRQNVVDMLDPEPGQSILDVGSGLGIDAISFSRLGARVVGVDSSASVVERAWQQLGQKNIENATVTFRQGREEEIVSIFGEGVFDAVYTQRLLEHIESPRETVSRLAKVVRRGTGKIVIAEPDWGTYIIDHPNIELAQKVEGLFRQQIANPFIGRKVRRLLREAGLKDIALRAVPVVFVDPDASGLASAIKDFVDQGVLSEADASDFMNSVDEMRGEAAFTSSLTIFVVRAHRPLGKLKPVRSSDPALLMPKLQINKQVPDRPSLPNPHKLLRVPSAPVEITQKTNFSENRNTPSSNSNLGVNEMELVLTDNENEGLVKLPV